MWEGLRDKAEVDVRFVEKEEQQCLDKLLRSINLKMYDRVVLDLLFRYVSRYAKYLRQISGLVLYEEDAYQEFMPSSRWFGKFSEFYKKLPNARVILTGFRLSEKFRQMGIDAHFLPKGFDSSQLRDLGLARDVQLGFIGRLKHDAYAERRAFLEWAARAHQVQLLRTTPGADYRNALNTIRMFVSADIGLGEYMAKNFEAMACGCVLIAHRQGGGEEEALGLEHGQNVLLYDQAADFSALLQKMRDAPEVIDRISAEGKTLAIANFDYRILGRKLYDVIVPEFIPVSRCERPWGWLSRLRRTL